MDTFHYLAANNGDGTSSVWFFDSFALAERLAKEDPEGFGANEGEIGSFSGIAITGITVTTVEEVDEHLENVNG